jgi:uncharacterized protein YecA (UPF0149 family)
MKAPAINAKLNELCAIARSVGLKNALQACRPGAVKTRSAWRNAYIIAKSSCEMDFKSLEWLRAMAGAEAWGAV